MLIGPVLIVPLGFAAFTIVAVVVEIVIGEIAWKFMEHLPEDEQDWASGNRFVIQYEE